MRLYTKAVIYIATLASPAYAQAQIHFPEPANNGFVAQSWQDTPQGREMLRQQEESHRIQEENDRRRALLQQQQMLQEQQEQTRIMRRQQQQQYGY